MVVALAVEEDRSRRDADEGHQLEGVVQPDVIGHLAGDKGTGGQPQQVVGKGQGRKRRTVHAGVGEIGHHGAGGARGAGGDEHPQTDQHQLGEAGRQGKRQGEQETAAEAIGDGEAYLAIRPVAAQPIAQHTAQDHAGTAAQHYDGGHESRLVRVQPVVAVEIARHPDDDGAADEQLQAAAHVGRDHRAAGIEAAQGVAARLAALGRPAGLGDPRLLDDEGIDGRQHQTEQGHAGEGPAPAEEMRQHAPAGHAEHRAEHAAGDEGAGEGGPHLPREHRDHHGDADTAVGGLPHSHQEAGDEHLLVVLCQGAAQGRQAPERGHHGQALDPAEPVRQQGEREGEQADHERDYAAEQAELGVGECPLPLEHGEDGVEHLARHVIGDEQTEGQRKHYPGITTGHGNLAGLGVVIDMKRSHTFPRATANWVGYSVNQPVERPPARQY